MNVEHRDGRPIRSQVVNNVKLYRQLINQLVQDVCTSLPRYFSVFPYL